MAETECLFVRPPRGKTVTAAFDAQPWGFSVKARRPERFQVRLRRFGQAWSPPVRLRPERSGTLFGVPVGGSPVPWRVEVTGSGRFVLCERSRLLSRGCAGYAARRRGHRVQTNALNAAGP